MQQRQLRLGDILDDYCPRERRVTNHAVVAMVGPDVKQTRCTTCDAEHEYKHAKVPRQRKKADTPAVLYAQVASGAPKRVAHETDAPDTHVTHVTHDAHGEHEAPPPTDAEPIADEPMDVEPAAVMASPDDDQPQHDIADVPNFDDEAGEPTEEEGPVHRPLIRASLPRPEGQPPASRPIPEFTIRQPGGRPNRFRPRGPQRGGGQSFFGNRSNGNTAGGFSRQGGGRPPQGGMPGRGARRHGSGRKRSK